MWERPPRCDCCTQLVGCHLTFATATPDDSLVLSHEIHTGAPQMHCCRISTICKQFAIEFSSRTVRRGKEAPMHGYCRIILLLIWHVCTRRKPCMRGDSSVEQFSPPSPATQQYCLKPEICAACNCTGVNVS
ncbi:hypothetical protein EJ08DRAFT_24384 [Tothia fuscella]|uniref:Uncharacterized protein n=1 Tax=Tothia fuscella TaxID=1048955 RepID=A0A9P4NGN1_9PEZI|nr:hypothetical protein EJ08DRAFT_24384 [Tothia fuscella]